MLKVTMTKSIAADTEGHLITGWENNELVNYMQKLTVGDYGWIRLPASNTDYNIDLHFRVLKGGPAFTNAVFTEGDRAWVTRHIGEKLTTQMLRDK